MAEAKVETKKETAFKQAVDWAVEESMVLHGQTCGVCTWRPWDRGSEAQTKASIAQHIRRKHRDTIVDLHKKQQLDLSSLAPRSDSEDELLAVAGLTDVVQLDKVDLLEIPEKIRREAEINGETFIWKRREEVEYLKQQGGTLVQLNGERGPQQHSTENGTLQARELVCMKVPYEVAQQRRRQKDARVESQLQARAEEVRQAKDQYEKQTYDYLRSERNLDHNTAQQVARAMMLRRSRELGGSESNLGISVSSRHGEKEY